MLCANHHAAFDAGLFALVPESIEVVACGPYTLEQLEISRDTLRHLAELPASEALKIRYEDQS